MAAVSLPYSFKKKLSHGDVRTYMRIGLLEQAVLSSLKVHADVKVVMKNPILMKGRGRMHSSHLKSETTWLMHFSPNFNNISTGWKLFCRKNNLRAGDTLLFTIQSTSLLHVHLVPKRNRKISSHKCNRQLRSTNSLKHPKLQPRHAPLSHESSSSVSAKLQPTMKHYRMKDHGSPIWEMKEEPSVECSSTNIRKETKETQPVLCYVELKSCHLRQPFTLNIPKEFGKRMPQTCDDIVTLETMSKAWHVTCSRNKFTSGWDKFVKDLGLEEGDICIFKLTSPRETIIHVYIYKKNKGKLYAK